jgi:hypothetical protein
MAPSFKSEGVELQEIISMNMEIKARCLNGKGFVKVDSNVAIYGSYAVEVVLRVLQMWIPLSAPVPK